MSFRQALRRAAWPLALAAAFSPALGQIAQASADNGAAVYQKYCVTCHGVKADGAGAAARLFKPPPADLTKSTRPDDYKQLIIRVGGEPMGRSPGMPPWGQELSEQQIADVVQYLRTVSSIRTVRP
jgi:mono/diheme cytochrome c family protein